MSSKKEPGSDDRLTLAPLTPEDALRAFMAVDPAQVEEAERRAKKAAAAKRKRRKKNKEE